MTNCDLVAAGSPIDLAASRLALRAACASSVRCKRMPAHKRLTPALLPVREAAVGGNRWLTAGVTAR